MEVQIGSYFSLCTLLVPHEVVRAGKTHPAVFRWPVHSSPSTVVAVALPMHRLMMQIRRKDRSIGGTRISSVLGLGEEPGDVDAKLRKSRLGNHRPHRIHSHRSGIGGKPPRVRTHWARGG